MTALATEYLGLSLRSPIVASAGPLTANIDRLRQLDDAGVGAVVLPSLFEEEIEHDAREIDQDRAHLRRHPGDDQGSGHDRERG